MSLVYPVDLKTYSSGQVGARFPDVPEAITAGASEAAALVLPAVTLASGLAAVLTRMTRAAMLEALPLPHVKAARARGLSEFAVVLGHVCRNASLPVVTVIGLQLGALVGGAVVTETVFNWPGLGQLLVESIQRRDYPVVLGAVLLIALTYILVNTLIDLLYTRIDPRIGAGRCSAHSGWRVPSSAPGH